MKKDKAEAEAKAEDKDKANEFLFTSRSHVALQGVSPATNEGVLTHIAKRRAVARSFLLQPGRIRTDDSSAISLNILGNL